MYGTVCPSPCHHQCVVLEVCDVLGHDQGPGQDHLSDVTQSVLMDQFCTAHSPVSGPVTGH